MRISAVVLSILLGCAGNPGFAAGGSERPSILAFVQKHKDLYASEIKDDAPFSRDYVSRRRISKFELTVEYNDSSREITIAWDNLGLNYDELAVLDSCVKTGSGVGTTAMGVKVPFSRMTCHTVKLTRFDGNWLGASEPIGHNPIDNKFTINGDPSRFRDLRDRGIDVQITFAPIKSGDVPVKYEKTFSRASIDYPYEETRNNYSFPGRTKRVEYFFVGGKTSFHTEQFQ